jgi:hypothetical protein
LSPELIEVAAARGYHALSVTLIHRLRGRGDHIVARYALDRDLVLITGNIADFERIYQEKEVHPGLIFFASSHTKLLALPYQQKMMELALDEIDTSEPVQEVVYVAATALKSKRVKINIERYFLPELSPENKKVLTEDESHSLLAR